MGSFIVKKALRDYTSYLVHRAGLRFHGARGLLSARGPLNSPSPNDILNTEFRKIQKSFCISRIEKLPGYTLNILSA
jgi:hypothetical protein